MAETCSEGYTRPQSHLLMIAWPVIALVGLGDLVVGQALGSQNGQTIQPIFNVLIFSRINQLEIFLLM